MTVSLKDLKNALNMRSLTELPEINYFHTGNLGFDYMLGGGIPLGKFIQIIGTTNLGKTTFCTSLELKVLREFPEDYGVLHFDTEGASDESQAFRIFGPEMEKFGDRYLYDNCKDVDEICRKLETAAQADFKGIIVIDSIAGIQTEDEIKLIQDPTKSSDSRSPGSPKSVALSRIMGYISGLLVEKEIFGVFVNQARDKVNQYMTRVPRPGGTAIDFFVSHNVILGGTNKEMDMKSFTGSNIVNTRAYTEKARGAKARLGCEIGITADTGIDPYYSAYELLLEGELKGKVLERQGNRYYLPKQAEHDLGLTEDERLMQIPLKSGKMPTPKKTDVYAYLSHKENQHIYEWLYQYTLRNYSNKRSEVAKDLYNRAINGELKGALRKSEGIYYLSEAAAEVTGLGADIPLRSSRSSEEPKDRDLYYFLMEPTDESKAVLNWLYNTVVNLPVTTDEPKLDQESNKESS